MNTSNTQNNNLAHDTVVAVTNGARETLALGARIAETLQPGDCVALFGELAAGKTQLAKGIASGLGIDPDDVASPTFVLHACYQGTLTLHHVDAYRMKSPREMDDLALADFLDAGGVAVVEWADRVRDALPEKRIEVTLEHAGVDRRRITIRPVALPHLDPAALLLPSAGEEPGGDAL